MCASQQLTVGKRDGRVLVPILVNRGRLILHATVLRPAIIPRGHVGSRTEEMEKSVASNEDGWGEEKASPEVRTIHTVYFV